MSKTLESDQTPHQPAPSAHPMASRFVHPEDVVAEASLTTAEKRAILASWASDAHAIADAPSLRRLASGATVRLDEILDALRALDGGAADGPRARSTAVRIPVESRQAIVTRWRRKVSSRPRRDDDDDPPPCPASNALPIPLPFVPAFGRRAAAA